MPPIEPVAPAQVSTGEVSRIFTAVGASKTQTCISSSTPEAEEAAPVAESVSPPLTIPPRSKDLKNILLPKVGGDAKRAVSTSATNRFTKKQRASPIPDREIDTVMDDAAGASVEVPSGLSSDTPVTDEASSGLFVPQTFFPIVSQTAVPTSTGLAGINSDLTVAHQMEIEQINDANMRDLTT